jgi:hypothetical protein
LAQADAVNAKEMVVYPIMWSSTVIKRVCRSTMMAETFAMIRGTEAGARTRAAIVDMKGQLNMSDWEGSSANVMGHVWMTDCDSLYEHLISTKHNSVDNKRLNVDLMALRQLVWERGGERQEYVDHSRGDFPRWIDTSTMIADPLTKAMSCERLSKMLTTGIMDLSPTQESLIIKAKNKLLRKKAKDAKKPKDAEHQDEEAALDEGHEDGDGNIAWRAVKNTENEMFTEDDSNTDIDGLLEKIEKAKEFIEIADKNINEGEMKELKDMAKSNHRRCGHKPRLVGRLDEFQ